MISLDKREQSLNIAMSEMEEVRGLNTVMNRTLIEIAELNRKSDMSNAEKIALLTAKNTYHRADMVRQSLLKQAYNNLKFYFGEHEANKIIEA